MAWQRDSRKVNSPWHWFVFKTTSPYANTEHAMRGVGYIRQTLKTWVLATWRTQRASQLPIVFWTAYILGRERGWRKEEGEIWTVQKTLVEMCARRTRTWYAICIQNFLLFITQKTKTYPNQAKLKKWQKNYGELQN